MRKVLIIGPVTALLCACCLYFLKEESPKRLNIPVGHIDTSEVITIPVDLSVAPVSRFSDLVEDVFYLPLQETKHSRIIRMSDLFMDDEHIVVVDEEGQKLVGFDFDGNYLFDVYKKGNANYEYTFMEAAAYDREKNEILVADTKKYIWYDTEGNMVRSYRSVYDYPHSLAILENSGLAIYTEYRNNENSLNPASLNVLDLDGELQHRFLPARTDTRSALSLGNYSRFNGRPPHILFSRSYSNDIYELSSASQVNLKYKVDFGTHNFPEDYAETVLTNPELSRKEVRKFEYDNQWARLFASGLETENFLFIPFHFQKETFYAYYHKKSGSVKYYHAKEGHDIGGMVAYPMDVKNGYFVSFVSPEELRESVRQGLVKNPENITRINQIENTYNPVLRFVKLREF